MDKANPKVGDTVIYRDGSGKLRSAKIKELSTTDVADLEYEDDAKEKQVATGVPRDQDKNRDSIWYVD